MNDHSTAAIGGYRSTHRNPMPSGGGDLYPAGTLGHQALLCLPLRANAVDVGPHAFPVTNHGSVTFDPVAGAGFNGVDQYLSIPDAAALDPVGAFTIALCASYQDAAELASAGLFGLVSKDDSGVTSPLGWDTGFLADAPADIYGQFTIAANGGTSAPSQIAENTLTQIVIVFDQPNHAKYVYLNGALDWSVADTPYDPVTPSSLDLLIGTATNGGPPVSFFLHGKIRDIVLASRAWALADVTAHYNGGNGHADGGLSVVV